MKDKRLDIQEPLDSEKREQPMVRINGREQILDMLRTADADFRELILTRLAKRDSRLARELREEL
jgi:hypothetical protein